MSDGCKLLDVRQKQSCVPPVAGSDEGATEGAAEMAAMLAMAQAVLSVKDSLQGVTLPADCTSYPTVQALISPSQQ